MNLFKYSLFFSILNTDFITKNHTLQMPYLWGCPIWGKGKERYTIKYTIEYTIEYTIRYLEISLGYPLGYLRFSLGCP